MILCCCLSKRCGGELWPAPGRCLWCGPVPRSLSSDLSCFSPSTCDRNSRWVLLHFQWGVPDVEDGLPLRETVHRGAVTFGRCDGDPAAGLGPARCRPSWPRRRSRLSSLTVPSNGLGRASSKSVDVEDQVPLRRGETRAEPRQVRVPVELHPKPRCCAAREVRCYCSAAAPVRRAGTGTVEHPSVPESGPQLRHPDSACPSRRSPTGSRALGPGPSPARDSRLPLPGVFPRAAGSARLGCSTAAARAAPRRDARAPDLRAAAPSVFAVMALPPRAAAARYRSPVRTTARSRDAGVSPAPTRTCWLHPRWVSQT